MESRVDQADLRRLVSGWPLRKTNVQVAMGRKPAGTASAALVPQGHACKGNPMQQECAQLISALCHASAQAAPRHAEARGGEADEPRIEVFERPRPAEARGLELQSQDERRALMDALPRPNLKRTRSFDDIDAQMRSAFDARDKRQNKGEKKGKENGGKKGATKGGKKPPKKNGRAGQRGQRRKG